MLVIFGKPEANTACELIYPHWSRVFWLDPWILLAGFGPNPGLRFSNAGSPFPSLHWVAGLMAATVSARRLPMGVRTFSDFLQIATVGSPRACRAPVSRGCLRQNIRWARHGNAGVYYYNDKQLVLQHRATVSCGTNSMEWEGYKLTLLRSSYLCFLISKLWSLQGQELCDFDTLVPQPRLNFSWWIQNQVADT